VAKINPVKVKQDAEKEEKAGRFDKAIALYRDIVADNPRDWNTIKKIGDLYSRVNRVKEASQEYAKVADFYARDGFLLKAIAVWKQINKLDPTVLEPYQNLADLYAKQGLMVEAKSQYQFVVDEYKRRGRIREAGDALKKMADIDPADLKIRSMLAELYIRDGNSAKAVGEHITIAEELSRKGHMAEALQVLEKGLKLDPKSGKLRLELARVHLAQKNYEKAVQFLEEAARQTPADAQVQTKLGEAYLGAKRVDEAEAIFRRILQANPDDQEARIQMGRAFLAKGQFDQAYEQFLPVVDRMTERKDGERAAGILQQIAQRNPGHVKTLVKLVEIYRVLRKESAVADTYSQLVEAYIHQGQMEQAASVLEILVELEPQNNQHRSKLEFVRSKGGGRPGAGPSAPRPGEVEEDFFNLGVDATPVPAGVPRPTAPGHTTARSKAGRVSIELSGPLSEDDKEFIDEHLAEGRVFRKYGLVDKSAEQFEAVLARFPDNAEARQELRDVHKEKGQNDRAAEQCFALAEICRLKGDTSGAVAHEADAQGLLGKAAAPEAPAAAAPAPPPPAARAPVAVPAAVETGEEEIPLEVEESVPLEMEESGLGEPAPEPESPLGDEGLALDLGEAAQGPEISGGFLEEEGRAGGEDDLALGLEELALEEPTPPPPPKAPAKRPPPARPAAPPAKPVAARPAAPAKPPPSRVSPRPTPTRPPAAPPPLRKPPTAPKAPPAAPPPRGLPAEIRKVFDEVESYISLGFVDDAKDALAELQARFPGHPAIAEKVAELGLSAEPAAAAPSGPDALEDLVQEPAEPPRLAEPALDPLAELTLEEPAAPPGAPEGGGMDLGAELDGLFGAQSAVEEPPSAPGTPLGDAGLSEIFKEFKKGVDKQLDKEDYDTRYNLGIAYKEMGLIDEAIAEFQLAAKDENRMLECASMLGICFMEKGMAKLAIKWFEKGLQAPGRAEDEYAGLRYDLATALEAAGETDKALGIYTDLYGQDANFRDVATKVRELRAALR
jgi:tetratricopeptide (TPR) repeat protein